jgi:hypothetical protein
MKISNRGVVEVHRKTSKCLKAPKHRLNLPKFVLEVICDVDREDATTCTIYH